MVLSKNLTPCLLKWGTDNLSSKGYSLVGSPEVVLETPWSNVIRFSTTGGAYYLKQTSPSLFLSNEPKIIRLLCEHFHASVPIVIDANDELHCFLMKDAGISLRKTLKTEFRLVLLCQAIKQYASIQRSAEDHIEMFLNLGIPDWRINHLPILYDQMLNQAAYLKAEGLMEEELQKLRTLSQRVLAQCQLLYSYRIPETIGYHDFHDKNVLIDPDTKKMTFIDWGEVAITHPFFSIYTCLEQAITHHGVIEGDQNYQQLQDACLEPWAGLATNSQLSEAFSLAKSLRVIWGILASNQFMQSVDLQAYKAYYPNKPNPIIQGFREYIASEK